MQPSRQPSGLRSWWCARRRLVLRLPRLLPPIFQGALLVLLFMFAGCKKGNNSQTNGNQAEVPKDAVEVDFLYSSEKEDWIRNVTGPFNGSGRKTSSGRRIFVKAIPMGSGEAMDAVLTGTQHAHLLSPASAAFIKLANAQSRAKTGKDLIASTDNLVLSPVVIAMWKPMAEALGWGKKPLGWSDILTLARNHHGWQSYGFPQWGQFKFGHTHPEYSNSGLISIFAEVYAAVGKKAGLTMADLSKPATGQFVSGIESSIVHYGSSTGFFGKKMFDNGPQYLSAAVLYENMVIQSYNQGNLPFPVVAIYPKEGTFWSDHPIGIVERDWVTPDHREAAQIYTKYLLEKPQQERAMEYGFRPASMEVPIGAPIDAVHGVDPKEPKTTLEVPSVEVIDGILKLWRQKKKPANVVLVLDTSGSMNDDNKLVNARLGARQLVSMLGDDDTFSLLPFNSTRSWAATDLVLRSNRNQANQMIDSLFANGGTALYDAIGDAYQHLSQVRDQNARIVSVVVLTDGEDNESNTKLDDLLSQIRFNGESHTIRVFTIAYGNDARTDVLKEIAEATQAKSYTGTPQNIVDVFKDISTFF